MVEILTIQEVARWGITADRVGVGG